ncbi:MAG: hypothetical protein U5K69_24465 [Balneolaceae bacterium]|nr:hypothetical protein [Balneolaceae bacterium]
MHALAVVFIAFGMSACDVIEEDGQNGEQEEAEVISQEISESEAEEAREFWTPQRLEQAEPVDPGWIDHEEQDPPALTEPEIPGPDVQVMQSRGVLPDSIEKGQSGRFKIQKDTAVHEASQVSANYTQYPYRTVGRVFFTKNEDWSSCSAAVIASENQSVVWTAGHCVSERGNEDWHDNWIFIPAYNNGNEPLGRWSARVKATFVAWHSNGNRNYDLGAVVVEQRENRSIASVTGSLGWMFSAQRDQDWRQLGYPASGSLFSGQNMWECFAPYDGADGVGSDPGPGHRP